MTQTLAVSTELTPTQSSAWLGMAVAKNQILASLTQAELSAQAILLPVKNSDQHADIDAALANYRKAHLEMIETRKTFTGMVDAGIIQPLMSPEKRVDPKVNPDYIELVNRSLAIRKTEADNAAKQNAKIAEIASFKSHCANEFYRIAEDVRRRIRIEVNGQYTMHLEQRISPDLNKIKSLIPEIQPGMINKFNPTFCDKTELQEIYLTLNRPDANEIYKDGVALVDTVFANFDSDLANAAEAIAHQQQAEQLATLEADRKMQEEMAMNTLIATSEAVTMDAPTIKKTLQITVVESELWAKSIMAAFILNMPHMAKYIRVKSWSKLSVGQMAEYLGKLSTDTGTTYTNLILNEVEK